MTIPTFSRLGFRNGQFNFSWNLYFSWYLCFDHLHCLDNLAWIPEYFPKKFVGLHRRHAYISKNIVLKLFSRVRLMRFYCRGSQSYPCTHKMFSSDFAPPTFYNQDLEVKRLENSLNFILCTENQTYTQERMTQINIWISFTKTNNLLKIRTKQLNQLADFQKYANEFIWIKFVFLYIAYEFSERWHCVADISCLYIQTISRFQLTDKKC